MKRKVPKSENKRKAAKKARKDEIIDSGSDVESDCGSLASDEHEYDRESDPETEQDKRIKEAKLYVERIKAERKRRDEDELATEDTGADFVKERMKQDYLQTIGRAQKLYATQFRQVDLTKTERFQFKKKSKAIISCMTVSPDGLYIFTGSKRASVCKWQMDSRQMLCSIEHSKNDPNSHHKTINAISVSHDNKLLAIGDDSKDITIRKTDNLEFVRKLNGHRASVTALVFHCDSTVLYSASSDKTVKIWSADEMMELETLYGHEHTIRSIDFTASPESNAEILTAGGQDNTIRLFKTATESQLVFFTGSVCVDIVRLIDNDHFVSGANNGDLSLWSKNKKKPIFTKRGAHSSWIVSLAVLRNSNLIASGDSKGLIILWKIDRFQSITELSRIQHDGFVNSMLFSNDSKRLFAAFGAEHRFGRWEVTKAPTSLLVYALDFN